ncbi:hypothetical protein NC653_018672 [Populus alba x Populus x berolinensis]|uniref:Uncharacterized protein n=1 Tax=Populus alba x Populus x berolinensis TaxID=444605 RepID=A0AAD6QGY0_9ROSI|nr:hypothetical protein NC653_018672 [Populus alba x Populus x berolinensis]
MGLYHSIQSFLFYIYIYISLKSKSLEPICMLLLMLEGLKRRGANRSGPISFLSIGPHLQQVMTVTYRSITGFFLGHLSYPSNCMWREEGNFLYIVQLGDSA